MPEPSELSKLYRSRYAALENKRAEFVPLWTDIRDFLAPRTARFKGEKTNSGVRQDLKILDTSPRLAVRTLAAGMQSGVTSPMRPWFRLGTPDPGLQEFAPVKLWLYSVQQLMLDVFSKSNLYDRLKSNYAVLGTYGTSGFGLDEDERDIIRAYDYPMGSFMLATDATGRVNTMYRDINMTAWQMVQKFGARTPDIARRAYDRGDYDEEFCICQIVEPNRNVKPGSALSQHKPIASVFFDPSRQGEEAILGYSGYNEMSIMGPRWDVLGEDVYGFGCGELALGDSKGVQLMEKRSYQILDRYANPNWVADASMRNQRSDNAPGGTTYVSGLITGKPGYQPGYQISNPVFDKLDAKIQRTEQRIDEAFFKNLFLMVTEIADQPNITATQINTMREEKLLMLGPVLERLNKELLSPIIDRTFAIMSRRGMIPPPPDEIQGMALKVEYISVLAQAQKAMGIGNIERFTNYLTTVAAGTGDLSIWDKVNQDELVEQYAEGVAVPPTLIVSNEDAQQKRAARAQQQQAAQMAEMAKTGSETVKNVAQADTGGDNALTRALNIANVGA